MKRLLLLSLTLLFVVQTSAAQTAAPPPTRDPVAVALVSKYLTAMTGGQTISDVTLQGTARRDLPALHIAAQSIAAMGSTTPQD